VSAGHAHELPAGESGGAVAEVEAGQIAYLTRAGQPVAALVPVSELVESQRMSDSAAIAEAQAIKARPGAPGAAINRLTGRRLPIGGIGRRPSIPPPMPRQSR
jgi:antitoxin (DNA-binding transcriptional repressor) of toxin-antitoxin stability system